MKLKPSKDSSEKLSNEIKERILLQKELKKVRES